jgi:hypothetical protein
MHTTYLDLADARIDDLRRDAERHRLARCARSDTTPTDTGPLIRWTASAAGRHPSPVRACAPGGD